MSQYKVEVKRNKDGFFEMHPSEPAIIVKYKVEAVIIRPDGAEVARGKKGATKLIHFTNLADATDLKRVAREAISRCAYLDPARVDELEQILVAIRNRKKLSQPSRPGTGMRPTTASSTLRRKNDAKISELPSYRSLLYNTVEDKITGTEMILLLAENKTHVAQIAHSDPVMNALARLLFEDESRNLDLKINICRIFACISRLSLAPALFAKNRIGGALLQEITLELQRYQTWKDGLAKHQNNPPELERFRKKFVQFLRKQDQFLAVALQLLLVIGHDLNTQTKMVKKEIVLLLTQCTERSSSEVQILALRFLLRLSLFSENLNKFVLAGTVLKVSRIVDQHRSADVSEMGLKLLYNLSLCPDLRKNMLKKGFCRQLMPFLEDEKLSELAAKILYSVSRDVKWQATPDIGSICARQLAQKTEKQNRQGEYLMALTANVARHPSAADEFTGAVKIDEVMGTSLETCDAKLLKVVNLITKNAAEADWVTKGNFALIANQLTQTETSAFVLECLTGVSIALDKEYLTCNDLISSCKLGAELSKKSQQFKKPAELLALVVLVGAVASVDQGAKLLTDVSITDWLCRKLEELDKKQEQISLQIVYALLKLTQYEPARMRIMDYPAITQILAGHTQRSTDITRTLCEELLLHLSLVDQEIHEAWKMERFQQYNGQWLQAIAMRQGDESNNFYYHDDNDEELDLVTRFGLDDLSDEMDDGEDDIEEMLERYSARTHSRLGFRP